MTDLFDSEASAICQSLSLLNELVAISIEYISGHIHPYGNNQFASCQIVTLWSRGAIQSVGKSV